MSEEAIELKERLRSIIFSMLDNFYAMQYTDDLLEELLDTMKYYRGDVVIEVIMEE